MKIAVFTIMLLGAAGAASANQRDDGHRPSSENMMQRLDANRDGQISRQEFANRSDRDQRADRSNTSQQFKRLDRNGDGSLNSRELSRLGN
ncbi:hypothetical protein [Paracoccus sp. Ld10]|uniref:hypothetical protein n=1 Tax=Paracoccus sp. Ld10 TaxID=649158 RepID=UPI0038675298